MSYIPTEWKSGDVVTSVKLNKLEMGVGGGYVPTVWQSGDIVTSEKLNKLEQGVADSGGGGGEMDMPTFTVTVGEGGTATATCDKTYNECKELCDGNDYTYTYPCIVAFEGDGNEGSEYCTMYYFSDEASIYAPANANYGCSVTYNSDGTLDATILH